MADIERVGVVGCGLMGSGIAEVLARSGFEVLVAEASEDLVDRGRALVERSLRRAERSGSLEGTSPDEVIARIHFVTELAPFADRDLVFEAVGESEELKRSVLTRLDEVLGDGLIASNTSSIPIIRLAMATKRPGSVLGAHFFNPAPVLPLVEVVSSLQTDEAAAHRLRGFLEGRLGKTVVQTGDRAGFVVNALLVPYLISAVRMLESGFADAEAIDQAMVAGCAHPMGPLRLCDLIGLDTIAAVAQVLYQEFKEPLYAPPPLLARMVEAGWHGRKSGRGFYSY